MPIRLLTPILIPRLTPVTSRIFSYHVRVRVYSINSCRIHVDFESITYGREISHHRICCKSKSRWCD